MAQAPASPLQSTAADYRRRARLLRHRLARRPAALHRALCTLAAEQSLPDRRVFPIRAISPQNSDSPAHQYARHVAAQLDGPVLRYSSRLRLLREADRQGIARFEANLIIATVQHRLGHLPTPARERQPSRFWPIAGLFILIECLIASSIWWIVQS